MSLSTMNWKRGLLRVWAVVSVLWVGVAFYSNDTVQRVRDVSADLTYTRPNKSSYRYPANLYSAELQKVRTALINKISKDIEKERKEVALSSQSRGSISPYEMEILFYEDEGISSEKLAELEVSRLFANYHPRTIWPPLLDFAKLAFIPPLLLLALGYIGLWVGRGFRR